MGDLRALTLQERDACNQTISSPAFFALVVDALFRCEPLSVIRVSDGEKAALDYCHSHASTAPLLCLDPGFRAKFGCEGITCGELTVRLNEAVLRATHYAPTLGFFSPEYNLVPYFSRRGPYVDELFQYTWDMKQKMLLFRKARHVAVINRDPFVAQKMRAQSHAQVTHILLDDWRGAEQACADATASAAPLVLMSAALASKYIGPRIAEAGRKVVLDIGQAADEWVV